MFPGGFGAAKNLSDFGFKVLITHNSYFVIYGTFKFVLFNSYKTYNTPKRASGYVNTY